MDIDIFVEDDHPQRDLKSVTPDYLRYALNLQANRIYAMITADFQAALDQIAALFAAIPNTDSADVAAARAEDLAALQDLITKLSTPAPAAAAVTVTPASISGPVGTAISGQLEATGGTGPYTFAGSGSSVVVASDGSYITPAASAETDTLTVTATDSLNVASAPASVPVSIA